MAEREPVADLIWRGRLQLGDEPGIYGDITYAGLVASFPLELFPFDETQFEAQGEVYIIVQAEEVRTFSGYPGPLIVVSEQIPDPAQPNHWMSREIERQRLDNSGHARIPVRGKVPRYLTVSISADLSTPPGLCDEIVIRRLAIVSTSHYGFLGFRSRRREGRS